MAADEKNKPHEPEPARRPDPDRKPDPTRKPDPDRKPDEDPVVGKVYDGRIMRRLSRYIRPYWLEAVISSIAVCIKSLCDVAGPILVMVGVDRYLTPGLSNQNANSAV